MTTNYYRISSNNCPDDQFKGRSFLIFLGTGVSNTVHKYFVSITNKFIIELRTEL